MVQERAIALTETWLDSQSRLTGPSIPAVRVKKEWWLRILALLVALAWWAVATRADTLTLTVGQICQELRTDSPLPLVGGVGNDLARNLLEAQSQVQYASLQSLDLSIESVLRAIGLYVWVGGPTMITGPDAEPIVWIQSRIAIDPSLTVTLSPSALIFESADVEVSSVPEPTVWTFLLFGLGIGAIWWGFCVPESERIMRRIRRYRRFDLELDQRMRVRQ